MVVKRRDGCDGNVKLRYFTSDGTAVAGTDYEATEGYLEYTHGEMEKSIFVNIVDDGAYEKDENFKYFVCV